MYIDMCLDVCIKHMCIDMILVQGAHTLVARALRDPFAASVDELRRDGFCVNALGAALFFAAREPSFAAALTAVRACVCACARTMLFFASV